MRRALVLLALVAGCRGEPRVGVASQAVFVADPASYDYGSIVVGSSGNQLIVISTADDAGDDITVTQSECTDFSFVLPDPTHITIAEPLILSVDFVPTSAGSFACDLTFTGNDGDQIVNLVGTGAVLGPLATLVTAASLDFGDVPVTLTTSPQQIEVRNDGDATLTITSAAFTGLVADLSVVATGSDTLGPAESQRYDVTCSPTTAGAISGTWEITTDDGNPAIDVAITCNGVNTSLYVLPVPAVFGEVLLGDAPTLDFDLHYTGGSPANVTSVSIDTVEFTTDLDTTAQVPGGGSTPFQITFTPTADGVVSGTMTITTDTGDMINLGLSGSGATAILSLTPPDPVLDFGTVCVGQDSARIHVSLHNVGTGAFQVGGLENIPGPSHPFTGSSSGFPVILPPGIGVESYCDEWFSPLVAGEIDGNFVVHTNIPGDEVHQLPLHGRALEAEVGTTHTAFDYGAVGVGALSGAEDLGVVNCSTAAVVVAVTLTGADADAFQILPGAPTSDVDVEIGETSTWSTLFQPTHAGAHVATFTISYGTDGVVEIPLSGLGVEDLVPPGDEDGPGTYLACSSGGGAAGAWPVLLALLLLRRRSRTVR